MTNQKLKKRGFKISLLVLVTTIVEACNTFSTDCKQVADFGIVATSDTILQLSELRAKSENYILDFCSIDTVYFRFGIGIDKLTEREPYIIYVPKGVDTFDMNLDQIITSNEIDYDIDQYRKQNISFFEIEEFEMKISYPRRTGNGLTGVYIDSVSQGRDGDLYGTISFHLFANNLDSIKERELIYAIKNMKIK